jgi:gamma-glutamylcyclotransferase (GGCT)/AIG2-like uncharacterized protein YtfP
MQITHIVFYGTLMSDGHTKLHKKIKAGLIYKGPCTFKGVLYDLGRYPGLKPGNNQIKGELYEIIDNSLVAKLDEYEAHDNYDSSLPGFTRKLIELIEPRLTAWIYYYDGKVLG